MPELLETVLAALDAGVVIHGADTAILEANDRAHELLGLQDLDGRLAGDPSWVFLEPDGSPMPLERFPVMQVLTSHQPVWSQSLIVHRPVGADVWLEVNALPLINDDTGVAEVVVTFLDVTAREQQKRIAEEALAALQVSSDYARKLIETALDPLMTISPEGKITDVNGATEKVTGRTREELIGTDFSAYFTSPSEARIGYQQAFRDGKVVDYPLELRHTSGHATPVLYNASVYRDERGDVIGVFAAARDITESQTIARALERSERTFRLAMDGAPQGMAVVGLELEFLKVNPVLCSMLRREESWMLAHTIRDVIPTEDLGADLANYDELLAGTAPRIVHEGRWLRSDGSTVWTVHSIALLRDENGAPVSYISQMQDNADAHRIREDLLARVNHDPLTGLINREQLQAHVTHLLTFPLPSPGALAVLFCDIDDFKKINDTYGHAVGDTVLCEAAHRMASALRLTDVAARVGGDEFVAVLATVSEIGDAVAVAEKIRQFIARPIDIGPDGPISITASVGVVLATEHVDAHRLLRNADIALYEAKASGRDRVVVFDTTTTSSAAGDIRNALWKKEFVPWFQPIVSLPEHTTVGYEALARWMQPDGSVINPDGFLTDAKQNELIIDLDRTILEQSLTALSALPAPLHIAVNVSAASLNSSDYADRVIEAVQQSGADPLRLRLEFTETDLLTVTNAVRNTMDRLVAFGIRWYVDDFGTGYSSISHLRDMPIAGLKLDLSFTTMISADEPDSERLAKAMAGLADGLRLDTIAEGVETTGQATALAAEGWKHGQGFLFGHPEPDLPNLQLV